MGKYDPLKHFLEHQTGERIPMRFDDIERVLGTPLPKSKKYPAWWSNNPSNNTMTSAWLAAGFETEQVDTGSGKLVFHRVRPTGEAPGSESGGAGGVIARLHAALAGTVRFAEGVDPTAPTGEVWDAES